MFGINQGVLEDLSLFPNVIRNFKQRFVNDIAFTEVFYALEITYLVNN